MDAIVYSLKVSVFLIAFYLMFKSLMSRETLHRANRYLILSTIAMSFVLPLCYAGIGVCLLRMIISIIGVLRVIRRGERQTLPDGTVLVITDDEQAPFSWVKYIIINRKDHDENLQEILTHERAHIRCRHSIDVLVCDVFCCLQWFNPAMWLLRRELCAVHEYEADKAVLDSGINAKQYQILLIKKAAGGKWYSIANSFNHSKLKYRITMMSRKKSSGWTMAKALYVLPIAAFAAIAFANCSKTEGEITKIPDSQNLEKISPVLYKQALEMTEGNIPKEGILVFSKEMNGGKHVYIYRVYPDGTATSVTQEEFEAMRFKNYDDVEVVDITTEEELKEIDDDQVYMIVEEMPEYPGGELELRKFLAENVRYPEDAKEQKKAGKVFVGFVIDKEGFVRDVELRRGIDCESINNEAMRVVKTLPQWKPGKQRGQNVNVSFTVPINFQLN